MSIETGLVAELLADAGVTALIDDRVYSEIVPQGGTTPAVVYQRVARGSEQELDGPANLKQANIRLHCWSTSASAMWALADAVRSALDFGPKSTLGPFVILQIYIENEFPQSVFDGDRRDYRVIQDYVIAYQEG